MPKPTNMNARFLILYRIELFLLVTIHSGIDITEVMIILVVSPPIL